MMPTKLDGFPGFPGGPLPGVSVPHFYFRRLLPLIDDLAELKLTQYCLYLLDAGRARQTWLWTDDVRGNPELLAMMAEISALYEAAEILEEALQRAIQRHALLSFPLLDRHRNQEREALVLNTAEGRRLRDTGVVPVPAAETAPSGTGVATPFQLYQQNIGMLTPLVADQIRALEEEFPIPWICEAMEIAVHNNKRALAYVEAILERWAIEGRIRPDDAGEQWELELDSS